MNSLSSLLLSLSLYYIYIYIYTHRAFVMYSNNNHTTTTNTTNIYIYIYIYIHIHVWYNVFIIYFICMLCYIQFTLFILVCIVMHLQCYCHLPCLMRFIFLFLFCMFRFSVRDLLFKYYIDIVLCLLVGLRFRDLELASSCWTRNTLGSNRWSSAPASRAARSRIAASSSAKPCRGVAAGGVVMRVTLSAESE